MPSSILIVEDDHAACQILEKVIAVKYPGVALYTAGDGKSGLDCFIKNSPDIVITDVNMPVMDGIRMAWKIKSIKAATRIIVLSAFCNKTVAEASNSLGFSVDSYLLKPVNFEGLFTAIDRVDSACSSTVPVVC